MGINKNMLKSIGEKLKEVKIIDLGSIQSLGKDFEGFKLPFKKKSFAEQLDIKANINFFDKKNTVVKTVPFRKMPKDIREVFDESNPTNRGGEPSFFRIIEMKDNKKLLDGMKINERLLDFLLNIDMDYKFEDKTLWEEWEIKKGDYQSLIKAFANVITSETLLESLEIVVEALDKNLSVELVPIYCHQKRIVLDISKIEDPIDRELAMEELQRQLDKFKDSAKEEVKEDEKDDK